MESGGQSLWNAIAICETSKTSWQTGKLRVNEDLGNLSKDRLFHLVHWWKTSQIPKETQSENSSVRKESFTRNLFRICFVAGGIWKGDIPTADIEELEHLDASEIYPRRLNAKEVLITQKRWRIRISCGRWFSKDYQGETSNSKKKTTLRRESTARRENLSGESQGDREETQPEETEDDEEIHKDFWSIHGDFVYRHHIEPRVQFFVPREDSFPIPLKYIDVVRSTHTNLDVAQE